MQLGWFGLAAVLLAPQQPREFATIPDMLAAEWVAAGKTATVRGYRAAGDRGGGTFRFEAGSTAAADGGSVLEPKRGGGRWVRVVDPEEDARAEWFGAYGDGDGPAPHDDHDAINRCLAAYGRVRLLARTYGVRGKPERSNPAATYHAVDLGPYYRIVGAGRDKTRIKLLDGTNPKGNSPGDNNFIVLYNRDFHESAEYVVISDLTIDCNFDKQDKHTTIHAIGIRGGGALVERLNLRGYGTGRDPATGNSRECFVVHQTLVYKDKASCRRAAIYRDLDLTGCGHNGDVGGSVAEITHLCLGGANNFENAGWILPAGKDPAFDPANGGETEANWWPAYGGLVENCTIHDEAYEPKTQQSPLNGITYSDCIGTVVRGNRVRDFEGAAVFTMSWWNRSTTIVDNDFLRVTVGVALNMASEKGQPIQCPRHENVLIAHNTIVTGAHKNAPWGTYGISLFGGDFPPAVRMSGIHVRENTISGRAYTDAKGGRACPMGIKLQMLHFPFHDVRIEDNVVDLPDTSDAAWIPHEPYSQSLFFYCQATWDEAVMKGHVLFRGNRNREGKVLYPFLTDWEFKAPPKWGRGAAAR